MTKSERRSRIIARGESSGHSHIVTGDAVVRNENGEIIIEVGKEGAVLKHLMEPAWLAGREQFTNEHADIDLSGFPEQVRHGDVLLEKCGPKTYKYVPQIEYDPYQDVIQRLED